MVEEECAGCCCACVAVIVILYVIVTYFVYIVIGVVVCISIYMIANRDSTVHYVDDTKTNTLQDAQYKLDEAQRELDEVYKNWSYDAKI